jgi:hypothetical protein
MRSGAAAWATGAPPGSPGSGGVLICATTVLITMETLGYFEEPWSLQRHLNEPVRTGSLRLCYPMMHRLSHRLARSGLFDDAREDGKRLFHHFVGGG